MEENQNKNISKTHIAFINDQNLFRDFFSPLKWKETRQNIRKYLGENEDIFKLLGYNVAIAGLFLNLDSQDIHLKRVEVFFLLSACTILTWFVIKSLFKLLKNKHTELYFAIMLIPAYIGGTLILNIWGYLLNNFSTELMFYFNIIGLPLIAITVNLLFIVFFKFISKITKVDGFQLQLFFLITLNINISSAYILSNHNFLKTISHLTSFNFNNLYLIYSFLLVVLSEIRPFDKKSKKEAVIETIIFMFLIILPFIIKYLII